MEPWGHTVRMTKLLNLKTETAGSEQSPLIAGPGRFLDSPPCKLANTLIVWVSAVKLQSPEFRHFRGLLSNTVLCCRGVRGYNRVPGSREPRTNQERMIGRSTSERAATYPNTR